MPRRKNRPDFTITKSMDITLTVGLTAYEEDIDNLIKQIHCSLNELGYSISFIERGALDISYRSRKIKSESDENK